MVRVIERSMRDRLEIAQELRESSLHYECPGLIQFRDISSSCTHSFVPWVAAWEST